MKYIIRKYVNAKTAAEALALDTCTPVHDLYQKEPDDESRKETSAIGFHTAYPE